MKFLEKLSLIIFSFIICIISIGLILIFAGIIDANMITNVVQLLLKDNLTIKISLSVSIVVLLLALKCIFFGENSEDDGRNGVTLENNSGKLVISKESLETLIANVVKNVQGIEAISSRTLLDKNNNLVVYVNTTVSKDVMIKDASLQIQEAIKENLKKTAELEVKEVNVKVKNITNKKIKGLPAPVNEDSNKEETGE